MLTSLHKFNDKFPERVRARARWLIHAYVFFSTLSQRFRCLCLGFAFAFWDGWQAGWMADCWWPIPTITRWVASCSNTNYQQIEWKYLRCGLFFSLLFLVVLSLYSNGCNWICSIQVGLVCAFRNSICKLIDSYTHSL